MSYDGDEPRPGRPTNEAKLADIHSEALLRFAEIQGSVQVEREQCASDRRFYTIMGAMWEGALGKQFANRPKFEVNKIALSIERIFNEYRNNRIDVLFVAKDGAQNSDMADMCNGLYRADEQDSCAEEAYDNSFDESTGGGFGSYEFCCEYEDEEDPENQKQRIRILPIFDADQCVFFDLQAKRQDKSDARFAFKITSYTYDAYKDEFGDDPVTWPKEITSPNPGRLFDWCTPEVVYVAEYYVVEHESVMYHWFRGLTGDEVRHTAKELSGETGEMSVTLSARLEATGFRESRRKRVKIRRVHKYVMSGAGVLKDCGYIPGKHIPIVPQYGKRWYVDGIERCKGHVRNARDPQIIKNMTVSKTAEIAALGSHEVPIFAPEQMAGHETQWSRQNVDQNPYLLVNAILDVNGNPIQTGPIGYTKPPMVPPTIAALAQVSEQDLIDVLGNQQSAEEIRSNVSGKAVELVQAKIDMQSFLYMSNAAKARRRGGEIWLSMAKEVYCEAGRTMKTIGLQNEIDSVELQRPIVDDDTDEITYENDLSECDFDVAVDVGPSSSTKRAAVVRGLTGMMSITQDQETHQVLGAMAMQNMEGEGLQDVQDYFRMKLLRMGVGKPTDEEKEQLMAEMQNRQPDANTLFLQASALEAEQKAKQAGANAVLTIAKTEETQAKTAEILAGIPRDDQAAAIDTAQKLNAAVQATGEPARRAETQE